MSIPELIAVVILPPGELAQIGARHVGPRALSLLDMRDPGLDFLKLAEGLGAEASQAERRH